MRSRLNALPNRLVLGLAVAVLVLLAAFPSLPSLPLCPVRWIAGVECPTCGTTRSLWSIFHGDIAGAWRMNPLGFLVVGVVLRELFLKVLPRNATRMVRFPATDVVLLSAFFILGTLKLLIW